MSRARARIERDQDHMLAPPQRPFAPARPSAHQLPKVLANRTSSGLSPLDSHLFAPQWLVAGVIAAEPQGAVHKNRSCANQAWAQGSR